MFKNVSKILIRISFAVGRKEVEKKNFAIF